MKTVGGEMNDLCKTCNGACCKGVALPADEAKLKPDQREWMLYRGRIVDGMWFVDAPCCNLQPDGRCYIYATRSRVCRVYPAGGAMCRATRKAYGVDG